MIHIYLICESFFAFKRFCCNQSKQCKGITNFHGELRLRDIINFIDKNHNNPSDKGADLPMIKRQNTSKASNGSESSDIPFRMVVHKKLF